MPVRPTDTASNEILSETERRRFIDKLREDTEHQYGPSARQAIGRQLSTEHPYPWMYVYELMQNAIDAKARRCLWRSTANGVEFHHDGPVLLDKSHVRGMAALGDSTKGLDTIGFMGIGFKSVFTLYRRIRITGNGWRFGFELSLDHGDLGQELPMWFDALLPHWEDAAGNPMDGYTTAIRLEHRRQPDSSALDDVKRLVPDDDPARFAVFALRGLDQLRIDDVTWNIRSRDGMVEVHRSNDDTVWRWKLFVAAYRPSDEAMRRFLEAREQRHDQIGHDGQRVERYAVALLPLDDHGMPAPPECGTIYATLPTNEKSPFGFELQADWLVNADRGVLREVAGNSWQEAIVHRIPTIIRDTLLWYANEPVHANPRSYDVLCDPTTNDGPLARCLYGLRGELDRFLSSSQIAPIHGAGKKRFLSPECVARLPSGFQRDFHNRPDWRPDLLFGRPVLDEGTLGERGTAFARWLGWGREIDVTEVRWSQTLPHWWSALPLKDRVDALFALWNAIADHDWRDAPVVPTASGKWIAVRDAIWLTEEPPSVNEPYGGLIADALREHLPHDDQRLSPDIRHAVNRSRNRAGGLKWFLTYAQQRKLPDAIQRACASIQHNEDFPLVELARWAVHRGEQRRDFVPIVATEQGPLDTDKALVADPLIEGGESRRRLFADTPAIVGEYVADGDAGAIVRLLERAGARGGGDLVEERCRIGRYSRDEVAQRLDVSVDRLASANDSGYTIIDFRFPFHRDAILYDVLQDWLSREYTKFSGKGRLCAQSFYYNHFRTLGRAPASWVVTLQDNPWVLCKDGDRLRPADVVLELGVDFEDAPIADIDSGLAKALEAEGVRFGSNVSKSPVLRRLSTYGPRGIPGNHLSELLREANKEVESGDITGKDIRKALDGVVLQHETGEFSLHRIVQRTSGKGARGTLGGWAISLSELDDDLVSVLESVWDIPDIITGRQSLGFLLDVWDRRPKQVERIRSSIATAFRYVFADIDSGELSRKAWDDAREHAYLFGGDAWHARGLELVVEDTRSPLIRKFLSSDQVAVSASHLGEEMAEIRRTAQELGLDLLSDEIEVERSAPDGAYPDREGIEIIVALLASLPDRQPLRGVFVVERLMLRVAKVRHDVNAYIDGEVMYVVGGIKRSAVEVAGQLVEYFRLGQRGEEVVWLVGALSSIDDEQSFRRNLEVLAEGLGVGIPHGTTKRGTPVGGDTETESASNAASGVGKGAGGVALGIGGRKKGAKQGIGDPVEGGGRSIFRRPTGSDGTSGPVSFPADKRRLRTAADRFGAIRVSAEQELERPDAIEGKGGEIRDDSDARRAVLNYERKKGRIPNEMPPDNPGYDIESREPETDIVRRIEVKGVRGVYRGDASVILSDRQGRDALRKEDRDVQYWLYVVDRMETNDPTVHPVQWTKRRLQFGFYASVWTDIDE